VDIVRGFLEVDSAGVEGLRGCLSEVVAGALVGVAGRSNMVLVMAGMEMVDAFRSATRRVKCTRGDFNTVTRLVMRLRSDWRRVSSGDFYEADGTVKVFTWPLHYGLL
jgi:hypothetical protein